MRLRLLLCLCLGLVSQAGILFAQSTPSWQPLNTILQEAALANASDIDLIVLHQGEEVYRHKTRFFATPDLLPIASASKWLAGAAILSLVDDGLLDLDDPVGLYLPYFREEKAEITVRQLLTHTSGLGGDITCMFEPRRSLDFCAQQIALSPLLFSPGEGFFYGDVSLQVAARVAEVVAGKLWNDLFRERIAIPLGMERSTFNPDRFTSNPQVAAGASSTADEYMRFLRMVRNRGVLDGNRVLSESSSELMLADQTGGAPILSSPYQADERWKPGAARNRYGFTTWIEGMQDGVADANSAQGSFGVSPYLDRRRDLVFLAFLRSNQNGFAEYYYQIQDFLNQQFPLPEQPKVEEFALRTLTVSTGLRSWFEYVPAACRAQEAQCPLLIAVHPNGTNGSAFAASTGLRQKAERERIILALPNGLVPNEITPPGLPTPQQLLEWELGIPGWEDDRDDAAFLFSMSAVLEATHRVDSHRIYLGGYREGADLAQRLLCRSPERFAALAAIRPTMLVPSAGRRGDLGHICEAREAAAVFFFDAPEADTSLGDDLPDHPSEGATLDSVSFWKARNRCSAERAWSPMFSSALQYRDTFGCWPDTRVRTVRTVPPSLGWPENAWEVAWETLRGHRRVHLQERRFVTTSAASYLRRVTSPGALVSLFGIHLSPATASATELPLPFVMEDVRVEVRDRRGLTRHARLLMVSPLQVNLVMPDDLAPGTVSIFLYRGFDLTHRDWMVIDPVAPALFSVSANGEGVPAGEVLYVMPDGTRSTEALWQSVEIGGETFIDARPIVLRDDGSEVFLTLYGTGWRHSGDVNPAEAILGSVRLDALYQGAQGQFEGLDQLNLRVDAASLPSGWHFLQVAVGGRESNRLLVRIEHASSTAQ